MVDVCADVVFVVEDSGLLEDIVPDVEEIVVLDVTLNVVEDDRASVVVDVLPVVVSTVVSVDGVEGFEVVGVEEGLVLPGKGLSPHST